MSARSHARIVSRWSIATEPNLLEETFDYGLPPLIRFDGPIVEYIDGKPVEFDPQPLAGRDIVITDTTFRDGQQARPPYTVEQMVHIYDLLAKLGGPQRRHPPDRVLPLHQERPRDARPLPRAGAPLSRVHRLDPRRQGRLPPGPGGGPEGDRHADQLLRLPHLPQAQVQEPQGSAWTATARWSPPPSRPASAPAATWKTSPGPTSTASSCPSCERLMRMSEQVPEQLSVKIRLCDTMGFGLSFPGAELPRSIPKLIYKLNQRGGRAQRPPGMARPQRLPQGARQRGHRLALRLRRPERHAVRLRRADRQPAAGRRDHRVHRAQGRPVRHPAPRSSPSWPTTCARSACRSPTTTRFVGRCFNTTRAGIHAGGLRQDERIYNIFDTAKLLGRPPRVAITDKSGADGVAHWVNEFFGLKGEHRISKIKMHKLARWVMDQYEQHHRADLHQRRGNGDPLEGIPARILEEVRRGRREVSDGRRATGEGRGARGEGRGTRDEGRGTRDEGRGTENGERRTPAGPLSLRERVRVRAHR